MKKNSVIHATARNDHTPYIFTHTHTQARRIFSVHKNIARRRCGTGIHVYGKWKIFGRRTLDADADAMKWVQKSVLAVFECGALALALRACLTDCLPACQSVCVCDAMRVSDYCIYNDR